MSGYRRTLEFIKRSKKILIVSHRGADVDGVVSSALMKHLISNINPKADVRILFPKGISNKAEKILDYLDLEFLEKINEEEYDLAIFLDVGGPSVLDSSEKLLKIKIPRILIDHHLQSRSFLDRFEVFHVDESSSSTCEMVYELLKEAEVSLNDKLLHALVAGIFVETKFFLNAKCKTFSILEKLCERVRLDKAIDLVKRTRDFSEKVAILKAFKRMSIYRADEWLFVFCDLSAYRSEAASQIMSVGVDFVAIGSKLNSESKVHVRLSKRFVEELGINAGRDLVLALTRKFGGTGGGHKNLATITLNESLDQVFKFLLKFLKKSLKEKLGLDLIKME